jgi:O-antigen/teichoic acid export membrane protein
MFPNSEITGMEWALPITVFALAWSDICLAALAYRHDVTSTVRARAIVEPWTISIAAFAWSFISTRDGLIIAYALSMVGALIASLIPFIRSYGMPHGWSPDPGTLWTMARRNVPVAAADAVEWGSRRIDIAVLGLFFRPEIVGIYYVAQNVASLPAKLKTSFDHPGPGYQPQPRRRRQDCGRQAGSAGGLLGDRRPGRRRAGARYPR